MMDCLHSRVYDFSFLFYLPFISIFLLFPSHLNLISLGFPKSSFLAASSERPTVYEIPIVFLFFYFLYHFLFFDFIPSAVNMSSLTR